MEKKPETFMGYPGIQKVDGNKLTGVKN